MMKRKLVGRLKFSFINPFHISRNKIFNQNSNQKYFDLNTESENKSQFENEINHENEPKNSNYNILKQENHEEIENNSCKDEIQNKVNLLNFCKLYYDTECLNPDFSTRKIVLWEDLFLKYNIYYKKNKKENNINDEYYDSLSFKELNEKINENDLIDKEMKNSNKINIAILSLLSKFSKNIN